MTLPDNSGLSPEGFDTSRLSRLGDTLPAVGAPEGGAFRARRTAGRRKAARVGGLALSVAALMLAVPLGVSAGGTFTDESLVASTPTVSESPSVEASPSLPPLPSMAPRPLETPDNPLPVKPRPSATPTETATETATPVVPVVPEVSATPTDVPIPEVTNIDELEDNPLVNVEFVDKMPDGERYVLQGIGFSEAYGGGGTGSFITPSGDVQCAYQDRGDGSFKSSVYCKTFSSEWSAARDLGCEDGLDWEASTVWLPGGAPRIGLCGPDTPLKPNPQVLGYNQALVVNGLVCAALESGLICDDNGGSGFKVSAQRLIVWGS